MTNYFILPKGRQTEKSLHPPEDVFLYAGNRTLFLVAPCRSPKNDPAPVVVGRQQPRGWGSEALGGWVPHMSLAQSVLRECLFRLADRDGFQPPWGLGTAL